ncbi:hypothetical protein ACHHYP_05311 [Achlya hypogyna]|uniref:Uncharacterized protein n=1 Tax=Achlya hypogyna TaxID=1202772 RepID=A0A1V9YYG6_ACHHY|nr:hypothetical protein ACHHYP_05311 [Achlya hypogyna]
MEAEDETGTLKQLKASLQSELDRKSDDDQYGSDFEEDFDEDVASTDALDDYDYVEVVEKP